MNYFIVFYVSPYFILEKEWCSMQEKFQGYEYIKNVLEKVNVKHPLIVCNKSIENSFLIEFIKSLEIDFSIFTDFKPNPLYEDVLKGLEVMNKKNCDFIISIGGGSAIDVAKCINLFSSLDSNKNYLEQEFVDVSFKHLSIPTTAGTGSESTRYAVIYYNGVKQSITHSSIIPNYVILEGKVLETLPLYQKKSTIMDALCQAIESYWSVNSTEKSKKIAKEVIVLILDNIDDYIFNNDNSVNTNIMKAANLSGEAINITQTTAAHAMSYKLTSLYGLSHGHAVALCLPYVLDFMINNYDKVIDSRGSEYLENTLIELSNLFGVDTPNDMVIKFNNLFEMLELEKPNITADELELLVESVNLTRLKNNPVRLDREDIYKIYSKSSSNYSKENDIWTKTKK